MPSAVLINGESEHLAFVKIGKRGICRTQLSVNLGQFANKVLRKRKKQNNHGWYMCRSYSTLRVPPQIVVIKHVCYLGSGICTCLSQFRFSLIIDDHYDRHLCLQGVVHVSL